MFARLDYLGRLGIWYLLVWSYPLFSGNSEILDFNEANITKSFNFKAKITTQIGANGRKDIEMIAPLKHQNNFWRTLEMLVINCEINLILTLFGNCVIAFIANANQAATLSVTDTKVFVPVVTLSTEDNEKKLQQLKSGFKRTVNWNKYQSKVSIEIPNQYLD